MRRELARLRVPKGIDVVVGGSGVDRAAAKELHVRHVDGDLRHSVGALRKLAR
jgi:hypothetical protein